MHVPLKQPISNMLCYAMLLCYVVASESGACRADPTRRPDRSCTQPRPPAATPNRATPRSRARLFSLSPSVGAPFSTGVSWESRPAASAPTLTRRLSPATKPQPHLNAKPCRLNPKHEATVTRRLKTAAAQLRSLTRGVASRPAPPPPPPSPRPRPPPPGSACGALASDAPRV